MVELADDEGPRQEPILTERESVRAYAANRQHDVVGALMSQDGQGVDTVLAQLLRRPSWHLQANCRGMGSDAFFPGHGGSTEVARAVCEGCVVRKDCLSAALAAGERFGVWGGLSQRGRRVLRRGAA